MQVLDDHYVQRARIAGLAQQRGEQLIARSAGAAQVKQLTAELIRDVEQRPKRAGSEQAIAGPPGPAATRRIAGKLFYQHRLADAGFAGDKHQASLAPACLPGVLGKRRQRQFPFEQRHASSVRHTCAGRDQAARLVRYAAGTR